MDKCHVSLKNYQNDKKRSAILRNCQNGREISGEYKKTVKMAKK